jgi:hypothetical protein
MLSEINKYQRMCVFDDLSIFHPQAKLRQMRISLLIIAMSLFSCSKKDHEINLKNIQDMENSNTEPSDFDKAFSMLSDFDLSDCISCSIEARHGYRGVVDWSGAISLEHRVVGYVWIIVGGIENSGLEQFLASECNHLSLVDSLKEIGLNDLSKKVAETLRLVPRECLGSMDELLEHFGSARKLHTFLKGLEASFSAAFESINKAHCDYIRKNKQFFEDLLPEIRMQNAFEKLRA